MKPSGATQNTNIFGAGGLGGACSIIVVWILEAYVLPASQPMPDEVSAAIATVFIIAFGILIPRSPEVSPDVEGDDETRVLPMTAEAKERARERRRKRRKRDYVEYQRGAADARNATGRH